MSTTASRPSSAQMLARGATRRCAVCGSGGLFRGWFHMRDHCPRCGVHFEREPGYWTGALAVNFAIVAALLMIVIVIGIVLTAPDVPVMALLAIVVPIAIIVPIASYPVSKTLWMALDRAFGDRLRES